MIQNTFIIWYGISYRLGFHFGMVNKKHIIEQKTKTNQNRRKQNWFFLSFYNFLNLR